jgi:hypothetical protein
LYAGGKKDSAGQAGTPAIVPSWTLDPAVAYPSNRYISGRGHGDGRAAAESSALAAVSRYFLSEIHSEIQSQSSYAEQNGVSSTGERFDEEIFVRSESNLFAVHYAEPWFDPAAKSWESLAYIDREEAWAIYEPRIRQKTEPFSTLFASAEADADPFSRFYRYSAARELAGGIGPLLDFAQILNPQKAAAFAEVRAALPQVALNVDAAKSNALIFIHCSNDADTLLFTALANAFSSHGFNVAQDEAAATNRCEATVSENKQVLEAGTFYTPSVNIAVTGKAQTLFTYTVGIKERRGAKNPDIAKRRAYTELAQEIQTSFYGEFNAKMSNAK